jgi:hypothetical protein
MNIACVCHEFDKITTGLLNSGLIFDKAALKNYDVSSSWNVSVGYLVLVVKQRTQVTELVADTN